MFSKRRVKRKAFACNGSKIFPVRVDTFSEVFGIHERKQEVRKVFSLVKMMKYTSSVSSPLKINVFADWAFPVYN